METLYIPTQIQIQAHKHEVYLHQIVTSRQHKHSQDILIVTQFNQDLDDIKQLVNS